MGSRRSAVVTSFLLLALAVCGCHGWQLSPEQIEKIDLTHYRDRATEIAFPDVDQPTNTEAIFSDAPRRIRHPSKDDIWEISLDEALHLAMAHNRIIRTSGSFLSPQNPLLTNPQQAPSVFDPAIQETGVLVGSRGVEAALSEFDARFTSSMLWGRNETVQNNRFLSGGLAPGDTLVEETGIFSSRIDKQMATGGSFAMRHDWNYSQNNVPSRLFESSFTGLLRAEYRQPLWAGSGVEFTRIAGPLDRNVRGISGVSQGVVISRINNDISLADFESSVVGLLKEVEDLYWDLSLSYRVYDAEALSRDSALATWRVVKAKFGPGLTGSADEAQARDNYFETRARAENSLADLYQTESRLRRLIGLSVNDGRVLRPADEPTSAEFLPDWHISLAEALSRRVQLRRQKWNIKSLQLQVKAAKSLAHPRLDLVSGYQVNAFGDKLLSQGDNDGISAQGLNSAYETLTQGDQTGWNLGFEFTMPIGYRAAHAQVRNLELRLAKARAGLAQQELEISHEVSHAFQELDRWYATAQTNFNRQRAAAERVRAFQAEYAADRTTLDLLLRSQISLANARIAYHRSLAQYNKAIADLYYRKGTLLEHNNVHLVEDLWDEGAYQDALRRAYEQSHSRKRKYTHDEPAPFVGGQSHPYADGSSHSAAYEAYQSAPVMRPTSPLSPHASMMPIGEPASPYGNITIVNPTSSDDTE